MNHHEPPWTTPCTFKAICTARLELSDWETGKSGWCVQVWGANSHHPPQKKNGLSIFTPDLVCRWHKPAKLKKIFIVDYRHDMIWYDMIWYDIIHSSHVNSVPSIWKYTIIILVECLLGHQKPCPMRIRWWPGGMNTQGYPASIWLHQIDRYWYCKYIPLPVHIAGLGLASDHGTANNVIS